MTQLELENRILELINNSPDIPYTDIQGIVSVIAMQAKNEGVV